MSTMRTCTICKHEKRAAIEDALLRNIPLRTIARDLRTSAAAIFRHKQHLEQKLLIAEHVKEVTEANSLLDRVEALMKDCTGIAAAAKTEKAWPAAISALAQVRACLELLARLTGQLQAGSVQFHAHLHTGASVPTNEADLEFEIARHVAEATLNFDEHEIARLKALLAKPMLLEASALDSHSNAPTNGIEQ
jgi:hypothetical protein